MKWDFRRLPPMNTDTHGCLGLISISRTRVGFFLLSFPKFHPFASLTRPPSDIGNLKYEEVRVYHEGHEEHEGLGLINIVMVSLSNPCLGLMVIIL
jgi:hypothetical protein